MKAQAIGAEPRLPAVTERQVRVFDEDPVYAAARQSWLPRLRRFARLMAKGDRQFAEDMVQEALIEMWVLDVTRYEELDRKALRNALFKRMSRVRRAEYAAWGGQDRVELPPEDGEEEEEGDA